MQGKVQALGMVSLEIGLKLFLSLGSAEAGRELGRNDHLISVALLLHPFAKPLLRLFILVVVCPGTMSMGIWLMAVRAVRVNEIASILVEEVEHLKGCALVTLAHHLLPDLLSMMWSATGNVNNADGDDGRHTRRCQNSWHPGIVVRHAHQHWGREYDGSPRRTLAQELEGREPFYCVEIGYVIKSEGRLFNWDGVRKRKKLCTLDLLSCCCF